MSNELTELERSMLWNFEYLAMDWMKEGKVCSYWTKLLEGKYKQMKLEQALAKQ